MSNPVVPGPVMQLRLVVEAIDFEAAVAFYRDALGLPEQAAFEGADDARVVILGAGRATLEIANPAQRRKSIRSRSVAMSARRFVWLSRWSTPKRPRLV